MTRAKITMDPAIRFRFPPAGFMKLDRFLEDVQVAHEVPSERSIARRAEGAGAKWKVPREGKK